MHLFSLAASVLGIEVEDLIAHIKKNVMAIAAMAFFALVGVVFLLTALNAWFAVLWGPIVAPLVIGGGASVVALAIWATIAIIDSIAKRKAIERRHSAEKTALVTTAALTALPIIMRSDLMKRIGIPVGGALAAAYLLAKPGRESSRDHD